MGGFPPVPVSFDGGGRVSGYRPRMTSRLLALTITAAVALGVAGSASAGRTGSSGWESAPFRSFSPYGTTHSGTWDTTYTYGVNGTKRTCTLTRGAKCVGAKLRGKVKHHGDLRKANLRRADLRFADLRGANLQGADLRSANLKYADLRGANLKGAKLQYAPPVHGRTSKHVGADPSCYPSCDGARLVGARLMNANLAFANLTGANLTGANLTNATLTNANLSDAKLYYAYLTHAYLVNANMTYSHLKNASLYWANLTHADLANANLSFVNLTYADLTNANLTGADLFGAMPLTTFWRNTTCPDGTVTNTGCPT